MTLLQFISVLNNSDINVSVVDAQTDKNIITFVSQGYEGVESELTARPVVSWSILGVSKVVVKVGTVEEP